MRRGQERGLSLIELVIAIALVGVGILAALGSFRGISRAIQSSKGRMLASNVAQEKMQILMQKSYYEVLVTTNTAYLVEGSSSIAYDRGYFPPETLSEGGMTFTRYTDIQVVQENSGIIQPLPPSTPDTGMRQITETVVWSTADGDKWVTVQNVLNNPNTVMSNAILLGVVRDAATGATIQNALVDAAENVGWRDSTDASGRFTINLSPGTLDFVATAPGYFPQIVTLNINANTTTTQNFSLTPKSTGTVTGTAWANNHLVVSQVVASTGPAGGIEYAELYNPTTAPINIGSGVTAAVNLYIFAANNQTQPTGPLSPVPMTYISTYVPVNGYYLMSNSSTMTIAGVNVTADAYYNGGTAAAHYMSQGDAGGVGIADLSPNKIDAVSWSKTSSGHVCPATPMEGACLSTTNGILLGEQFIRRTDTTSVITANVGNAYDSDTNSVDFFYNNTIAAARTSATTYPPITGIPLYGALVSVSDGLSVPVYSSHAGVAVPYAWFSVPGVATGTWSVFVDSGSSSAEVDNVTVVGNSTTSIPNAATAPAWPATGFTSVITSTSGLVGMISGQVTDALGTALSGITVSAGGYTTTTNSNGNYLIRMTTGTYDVIANPDNLNTTYASVTQANVPVSLADVTNNQPFQLSKGGRIYGWISRDGVNPLPSVTVTAMDSNSAVRDSEVSGNNGQFLLINLTTGTYTIQPVLDPKEVSSPTSASVTINAGGVTMWSSSFTITGAMGTVTGNVTLGGSPINSGVLVVIATGTVPVPLPALSSNTLTSAAYYVGTSKESGTFSVDVRSSTSTTYTATAFYQYLNNQTAVVSTQTVTGITVTGGQTTSGVNFAW